MFDPNGYTVADLVRDCFLCEIKATLGTLEPPLQMRDIELHLRDFCDAIFEQVRREVCPRPRFAAELTPIFFLDLSEEQQELFVGYLKEAFSAAEEARRKAEGGADAPHEPDNDEGRSRDG
jgi:hypothetical protein